MIDIKEKIINYVSNNIIATLSFIFLLLGGFIFYIYYLSIQYLPDINLVSSVTLLTFVSFTGLLLLFSTILMLIIPGILWHSVIQQSFSKIAAWSDNHISRATWFIVPISLVYTSVILCTFISIKYSTINLIISLLIFIAINCLWIGFLFLKGKKLVYNNLSEQVRLKQYYKKYLEFAFWSGVSSFISILPILLLSFIFLKEYQQDLNGFFIGLVFLTAYIIVSNLLVIATPNNVNKIYWMFVLGLLSFSIVTLYTEQAVTFPRAIMRTYNLGNIEASVVLNKSGCNVLDQYMELYEVLEIDGLTNKQNNRIQPIEIKNDLCTFPNMHILSRLGKESYVKINIKKSRKEIEEIKFSLPSSSIISYSKTN